MSTESGVIPKRPDHQPTPATDVIADLERDLASRAHAADDGPGAPASDDRRTRVRRALAFGGPIVALVLGIKLLIYGYGAVILETVQGRGFSQFSDRFAFWNAWDAPHYLSLAEHGYQSTGDAATYIVFFPGYPLAVRAVHLLTPGSYLTAALVASGIASITAALALGLLARRDTGGDDAQAMRAVWFLLIFPTAYFLHMPYTESLFLTFVIGAFYAARTGHWRAAGVIGMLAAFTRLNGVLLLPALAVEAALQYRRTRTFDPAWLWIGFVAVGLIVYLAINEHVFGDPLHFQDVQAHHWYKHFQNPYVTIKGMIAGAGGYAKLGEREMNLTQELLFLALGLIAGVVAFFRTRPSYAVWVLLNVALFASTSFIQSTPRYAITLFPIFLMLAQIKRQWLAMLVSAWSFGMLMWFTALFSMGSWAF